VQSVDAVEPFVGRSSSELEDESSEAEDAKEVLSEYMGCLVEAVVFCRARLAKANLLSTAG